MITVEEALERVLQQVTALEAETKPILESLGQVLAEDVHAEFDVPPLPNSAMDGYAVRAQDTQEASPDAPRRLRVVGELAAGYWTDREVGSGEAMRIMTGAPLPHGADAVVQFEHTDEVAGERRDRQWVAVYRPATVGRYVRPAGGDVRRGQRVLQKGTPVRPAEVGVLAALGRPAVAVIRRPLVGVLATGDELVEVGDPLSPARIYNSNTYSIAAQVMRCGGVPLMLGIARDRVDDLAEHIRKGLSADLLITSGGVSRGDYDVVKDVLAAEGEVGFWTVRMKPGKPLAFGTFTRASDGRWVPHLGLPGNPASSMVSFEQFARPAILKMLGCTQLGRPTVEAVLETDVRNDDGRRFFLRVVVERRDGTYYVRPTGSQDSNMLTSMSRSNGLAIIPEDVALAPTGSRVRVQMTDWPEQVWLV